MLSCSKQTIFIEKPAKWIAWLAILAGALTIFALAAVPVIAAGSAGEPPATPSLVAAAEAANQQAGPASVQVTYTVFLPIVQKPPLPAAFTKLSPSDGATGLSAGLGVVLSWTQSYAAAAYQICLSQGVVTPCTDGAGFIYTTTQTSWSTGQLMPGAQYFWHVRAINASGTTYSDGSQAMARSFSTRAAPGAFSKTQPISGSTNHAALSGVTLSWTASPNADGYHVCLTTVSSGCSAWNDYNLAAGANTSYATGPLLANTTYYWQVRADNTSWFAFADGNVAALNSFTTEAAPGAFNKLLPVSGSAPGSVRLEWGVASGATGYDICLSTNVSTCGAPGGYTINTSSTSYEPAALSPGTTYFWNVRARNGSGFSYANGSINNIWNFLAPAGSGGTDPCSAGAASQNVDYTTPQDRTDIYYALVVNQASTVDLSITGATGQLQFRTPNLSTCPGHTTSLIDYEPVSGGAASIRYFNVTPGTYYVRIATTTPGSNNVTFRWSATPGYTFLEPNNTACAPTTINVNATYTAYPENSRPDLNLGSGVGIENDFYQFTLSAQTTVQVQFSGYNAGQRQVQLRGGACASNSMVDSSAFVANASSGAIQRTLAAGTYWVRFVTIDGAQSRTPYTFTVSTSSWAPQMNTCWPFPPGNVNCGNGSYSGGQLTVYWDGAPGATQVQAILRGIGAGNCPKPPDRTETFAPPTVPQGSRQITGIARGYYGLTLKISGPQGTYTRNEMPVKMDCEFMLASPAFQWPGLIGPVAPTDHTADTPESPTARPTPIPMPGETPTPAPTPPLIVTPIP